MTDPSIPDPAPRRATDGLDWASPEPPAGPQIEAAPSTTNAPPPARPGHHGWSPTRRTVFALVTAGGLACAIVGGILGGIVVATLSSGDGDGDDTDGSTTAPQARQVTVEQTSAIAAAAASARPSVVKIESTRRNAGVIEQDVGSGVVLDDSGHIVTNAHVVVTTETLEVVLADGSRRSAIVVGHDFPFTDVAVLQVGPGGLTPLVPGDAASLALGETVIAIGNPLSEFAGSVSVGVVSGLDRERVIDGVKHTDFIQTDAALNAGNSGGTLVNLEGEFVGMPTLIFRQARSGTVVEGIGFAIPSDRVLAVAAGIIAAGGDYPRPQLGAEHFDFGPGATPPGFSPPVDEGAVLTSVAPDGPAANAGLMTGDVITEVEGQAVGAADPLLNALMRFNPGEEVRVVLNRAGQIIELNVRLGSSS